MREHRPGLGASTLTVGASWTLVGDSSVDRIPRSNSKGPVLALDRNGRPVAVWHESCHIHVSRWDGPRWESVGDALNEYPTATHCGILATVGLDGAGNPIVAWDERSMEPGAIESADSDADADADSDSTPEDCVAVCSGGTCLGSTCVIDCSGDRGCESAVVCPPGVPCQVDCSGISSCGGGVDCGEASSCTISCSGPGSCSGGVVTCSSADVCSIECVERNACSNLVRCADARVCTVLCSAGGACSSEVACGAGRCEVTCSGSPSCNRGVGCAAACACTVECLGGGSCLSGTECPPGCTSSSGCTAALSGCDSCP